MISTVSVFVLGIESDAVISKTYVPGKHVVKNVLSAVFSSLIEV